MEEPTVTAQRDPPPPAQAAGEVLYGRYVVERELGRGGMGVVSLVRDLSHDGQLLALKSVTSGNIDGQEAASLKHEFLLLATLRHPGIASVYDFGLDPRSQEAFFTSEFVPGVDLQHGVARLDLHRPDDLGVFLDLVVGILRALAFVHAHGVVHGDLKPQNILVTNGSGPRTKLIDFGIAAREHHYSSRRVLGTKTYIAPESIVGAHLDRRTDLYSFGAVLYHLVAQHPPFGTSSNLRILKDHVERVPPPPSACSTGAPTEFDAIVLRLLEKNPSDRFQNALEVVQALNLAFDRDDPLETGESIEGYLSSVPMRNRAKELHFGHRAFCLSCGIAADDQEVAESLWENDDGMLSTDTVPKPRAHTLVVRGEARSGRERFLKHLRALAQLHGAVVFEDPSVRADQVNAGSGATDRFSQLLEVLERTFACDSVTSAVEEVRGVAEKAPVVLKPDEERAVERLARALLAATASRPAVLVFENAGSDSLDRAFLPLLVRVLRDRSVPRARFLLVLATGLAAQQDDFAVLGTLDCESSQPDALQVTLRRLDREGSQQLVDACLPNHDFPEVFFRRVFESTDGNAKAIEEALRSLTREGSLVRTVRGWTLSAGPGGLTLPDSARAELDGAVARLSRPARNLAVAFAFLGRSAPLELATKLARLDDENAGTAIIELEQQGILAQDARSGSFRRAGTSAGEVTFSFVHATARELAYEKVPAEKREDLHNLAALLCLREYGDEENCEYLAEQFCRANNREQGILYSLRAADLFIEQCKLRRAVESLERVLKLCNGERAQTEATARSRLAHVQFMLGDFGEAIRLLTSIGEAVASGKADIDTVDIWARQARCYSRLGLFAMAESSLERAAGEAAARNDAGGAGREMWLDFCRAEIAFLRGELRETLVLTDRTLERVELIDDQAFICRCELLAAEASFALDDYDGALRHCQSALRAVDSRNAPELVDLSLFGLAKYFKYSGKLNRALKQFQLCAHSRRRLELLDGRAEALVEIGAIELFLERPRRALLQLDRAAKVYAKTKNAIGTVKSFNLRAEALRQLGRFSQATRLLRASEERQRTLGTAHKSRWESWFVEGRLRLDQGKLREAESDLQRAQRALPEDPRSQLKVLDCRAEFEYQRGNFGAVLKTSAQGLQEARRLDNRLRAATFLEVRAFTFLRLGEFQEVTTLADSLRDVASTSGLALRAGRACLLDAVRCVTEGDWNTADEQFREAEQIFAEQESERDLAYLHFYASDYYLRLAEFDRCFVEMEESLYLAKKLNVYYLKAQLFAAMGLFEAKTPDGDVGKAENYLSYAVRLSRDAGYEDVHWQVVYHLGCLMRRAGDPEVAARFFKEAATRRQRVIRLVPPQFRSRFLRFSAGSDLAEILRGSQAGTP